MIQPLRSPAAAGATAPGAGANKNWQSNGGQVPQGQRLVQGVMQGM